MLGVVAQLWVDSEHAFKFRGKKLDMRYTCMFTNVCTTGSFGRCIVICVGLGFVELLGELCTLP